MHQENRFYENFGTSDFFPEEDKCAYSGFATGPLLHDI
jgi:hypothetical protein